MGQKERRQNEREITGNGRFEIVEELMSDQGVEQQEYRDARWIGSAENRLTNMNGSLSYVLPVTHEALLLIK